MIISLAIEGMRIMVILVGFFALAGERFLERGQKHQIVTIILMMVCVSLRAIPLSDLIVRFVFEMELLTIYIFICYKKERWLHLTYMIMVYVAVDFAYVPMAWATYCFTNFFSEKSYPLFGDTMILVLYATLIFIYPKMMSFLKHWIGKITSVFFCAGISLILLFVKCVAFAFIRSEGKDTASNLVYVVLAVFAFAICCFWIADKLRENDKIQDFIRYEHRTRELVPAMGRAVKKLGVLPKESEEADRIRKEVQEICDTDERLTREEVLAAKMFATTGYAVLDGMLERYLQEAMRQGIDLKIIVRSPLKHIMEEQKIEIGPILQMMGDIYRNAHKVALERGGEGRIVICMGYNQNEYEVSVLDNGRPFSAYVLKHLGKRGVTTGGTGHGLADVFEIADKYKISFILKQDFPSGHMFSKSVSLIFDCQGRREICEGSERG